MDFLSRGAKWLVNNRINDDSDGPLYKPLNPVIKEFRVLHFDAEEDTDTLNFSMTRESPSLFTKYVALSYVWGEPSDTETVTINGHIVPVTKNLASALRYVRHYWKHGFPEPKVLGVQLPKILWLWVDALCIDQKNPQEKNHQVELMSMIFSKAALTISWLGSDEKTAIALSGIQLIVDNIPKTKH